MCGISFSFSIYFLWCWSDTWLYHLGDTLSESVEYMCPSLGQVVVVYTSKGEILEALWDFTPRILHYLLLMLLILFRTISPSFFFFFFHYFTSIFLALSHTVSLKRLPMTSARCIVRTWIKLSLFFSFSFKWKIKIFFNYANFQQFSLCALFFFSLLFQLMSNSKIVQNCLYNIYSCENEHMFMIVYLTSVGYS